MSSEQVNDKSGAESSPVQRIVVALDASPHSVAALRAAAELASIMGAELEGLFVEDVNLTHLCGFPYQQEIGSYTGARRRLDNSQLQRQMRAMASHIRQEMAMAVKRRPVRWTFHVRHGSVAAELLDASQSATVVSLGRASRRQRNLGSTAQSILERSTRPVLILDDGGELRGPLTVLYTGSEASERALEMAVDLQVRNKVAVRVLVWGEEAKAAAVAADLEARLAEIEATVSVVFSAELAYRLALEPGTLILPRENRELLSLSRSAAILVP